jgi:hypothetical protein
MTSSTLLTEVLTEARNRNPQASLDEISAAIMELISSQVLPEAIKNLTLPGFPSWGSIAAESKGRQRKKRLTTTRSLSERRIAIQQIERIRQQMEWDGNDSTSSDRRLTDSNSLVYLPTFDRLSKEKPFDHKLDRGDTIEHLTVKENGKTSPNIFLPLEPKRQIVFSEEIQRKVVSEPSLEEVMKTTETGMRKMIDDREIDASVEVSFRSDIEMPSWKRYVITVSPPPSLNFKDRMNLWTVFDVTVRKGIVDLAKNADDNKKKYLSELNRNLFVHLEL